MVFLGQASNYSVWRALRHLLAHGRKSDKETLKRTLLEKYGNKDQQCEVAEQVALYQTGRSALTAAIIAVAPKGSAVIIPGLTCIAVVRAVRATGCQPVFVDIDAKTLQYDFTSLKDKLKSLEEAQTPLGAIIVQNTLGMPFDMKQLETVVKPYKLPIIEDLAHCAGRVYPDGREIGTVGAATALSFGKGKAIDTISGGAVVLRDTKLKLMRQPALRPNRAARWRARWYPLLGCIMRAGHHIGLGKVFTAIFLKLHWIERSADAELNLDLQLCNWQAKLAQKQLLDLPKGVLREHALVKHRQKLLDEWHKAGYYLEEIWYDTPVSPARYLKEANFPAADCPNTVKVAAQIVNLPTWYPEKRLARAREMMQPYLIEEEKNETA